MVQCCAILSGLQCSRDNNGRRGVPVGDARLYYDDPTNEYVPKDIFGVCSIDYLIRYTICSGVGLDAGMFGSHNTEMHCDSVLFELNHGSAPQRASYQRSHFQNNDIPTNALVGEPFVSHLHSARSHWSGILQAIHCQQAVGRGTEGQGIFCSLPGNAFGVLDSGARFLHSVQHFGYRKRETLEASERNLNYDYCSLHWMRAVDSSESPQDNTIRTIVTISKMIISVFTRCR